MSDDSDHLADLSDGAGCAEVWEHLSEQREAQDNADEESDAETADNDAEADETTEDAPEQDAAIAA